MDANVVEARRNFAELINQAAYRKERISITRRGKKVAYIVPVEDVDLIERIEDQIDIEEGRKALEAVRSGREKTVPFEKVAERLGLKPTAQAAKRARAAARKGKTLGKR